MATTAFETNTAKPAADAPLVSRIGTAFVNWLVRVGEMSAAARAARYAGKLAELSDEQLATRGLNRDQIVEHAFRHLIHR